MRVDRMGAVLLVLAACGGSAPRPASTSSTSAAPAELTCADAASGLERATVDVRSPGTSVWKAMHERCAADVWPSAAVACFAHMQSEQLGSCAKLLPDEPRTALFGVLRGDHDTVALARARLATVQVGVESCDRFVAAVASLMDCERVSEDDRVRLGNETAELWDLPTHGLPESAQQRMTAACDASLAKLQAEAQGAGCVR